MAARRALLIGINYAGTRNALRGCINDIETMAALLQARGYVVKTLRDDDAAKMPTGARIVRELAALVAWTHGGPAREVFVHYSGHGSHTRDASGDEADGQDELIVPCDVQTRGCVPDDTLRLVLQGLAADARAFFVFDCCHSGSILDLPYVLDQDADGVELPPVAATVHMLSGCEDRQTSADAFNLSKQRKWEGALTWALTQALARGDARARTSPPVLLERVRALIAASDFDQVPQLSSSKPFGAACVLRAFD